MKLIKSVITTGLALTATAGAMIGVKPENEIVIVTKPENNITISWNLTDSIEKHFSVEHFENGDVDDAFIIAKTHHEYKENGFDMEWNVWSVEAWKNIDDVWFNIEIGK